MLWGKDSEKCSLPPIAAQDEDKLRGVVVTEATTVKGRVFLTLLGRCACGIVYDCVFAGIQC